jgi:hypothetical protein
MAGVQYRLSENLSYTIRFSEVWCFHGEENGYYVLLGYDVV